MAKACCGNCIYCEIKPVGEFHFGSNGKDKVDYYCALYEKWLGSCSGKCDNYVG